MVETAVLFQTFARPDYARQVFEAIKACKPKKFYFYSNKARSDKPDEIRRNKEIRSWAKEVDWDCEMHIWFREEYVDVYTSLRGSVDWVCEQEKEWIVLEEDVVPTPAFFSFCDQMIDYYRDNKLVWNVSGDNFFNINPGGYDYIFSHFHWMYGWATWRDRWLSINWDNLGIEEMISQKVPYRLFKTKAEGKRREEQLLRIKPFVERTKCWDYVFGIVSDQYGAVEVVPTRHLITNIGVTGEHHKNEKKSVFNIESTDYNSEYKISVRPPFVFSDLEFDHFIYNELYVKTRPFWKRIGLSILQKLNIEKPFRRVQRMVRGEKV